jgi:serine/threonine protein kinase
MREPTPFESSRPPLPAVGSRGTRDRRSGTATSRNAERGLLLGSFLGEFRLDGLIGRGGYSEVYRARSLRSGKPVAFKVVPDLSDHALEAVNPGKSRFVQELAIHERVQSRYIPRFLFSGRVHGASFIAMEYIAGESLYDYMTVKRSAGVWISADEVAEIACGLFTAIDSLARNGIVHRDLKPTNIMITRNSIKIIDFGFARGISDERITDQRYVVGTKGYMSPEQWYGHRTDERSDIYSAGINLVELAYGLNFTGRHELGFTTDPSFAYDEQWASQRRPDFSPDLHRLIRGCVYADLRLRHASARSIVSRLIALKATGNLVRRSAAFKALDPPGSTAWTTWLSRMLSR